MVIVVSVGNTPNPKRIYVLIYGTIWTEKAKKKYYFFQLAYYYYFPSVISPLSTVLLSFAFSHKSD